MNEFNSVVLVGICAALMSTVPGWTETGEREVNLSRLIGSMALLFMFVAGPCSAQSSRWSEEDRRWAFATWVDDLNFLSLNALLGGLTAGIVSHLQDGSFRDGFVGGAMGGGVAYVGKRIAAARFSGAGFLGREVTAVGGSMARNASLGVGVLDTLVLPIGPLRAFATPRALRDTRLRLNLYETAGLVYRIIEGESGL